MNAITVKYPCNEQPINNGENTHHHEIAYSVSTLIVNNIVKQNNDTNCNQISNKEIPSQRTNSANVKKERSMPGLYGVM